MKIKSLIYVNRFNKIYFKIFELVLGSVCPSIVCHIKILSCPDFFFDVFYYIDLIFEIQLLRKKKETLLK
jgi:hypothetical protein